MKRTSYDNPHVETEYTDKMRLWGGWYQHLNVFYDGILIGLIQTKRQHKRTSIITCCAFEQSCVMGSDRDWLIKRAIELNKITIQ